MADGGWQLAVVGGCWRFLAVAVLAVVLDDYAKIIPVDVGLAFRFPSLCVARVAIGAMAFS